VKIVAVSDLHGNLPVIPECDLLLIAGDVCPVADHRLARQMAWLQGEFANWLRGVPARHVIGVAGNHDFVFQQAGNNEAVPWEYLEDKATTYGGLKVYGTPWQPIFCQWAFNASEEQLANLWSWIPDDTEVLVTHGPPHGYGDRVPRGENVGSPSLARRVAELKNLKLMVFGHIHEGRGVYRVGDAVLANVSLVDGGYRVAHEPMVFEVKDGRVA
jgi:Icc-related predicted phosphoesterase